MLYSLLRAVMFAVREASQFDTAAHITGIDAGSRELIHSRVLALNQRGADQRHATANHINGNDIETFFRIGRQLPEIRAQQIGKRPGSIDALIPSAERTLPGTFDNRGANNGDRQILAAPGKN